MKRKEICWVGSSRKDLQNFPDEVKRTMGHALHIAQICGRYKNTKILKGFGSSGVIEIIDEDISGTYRVVYTIDMPELIFVIHVFQKKSKRGIETPKREVELIKSRLKQAQAMYKEIFKKK